MKLGLSLDYDYFKFLLFLCRRVLSVLFLKLFLFGLVDEFSRSRP